VDYGISGISGRNCSIGVITKKKAKSSRAVRDRAIEEVKLLAGGWE